MKNVTEIPLKFLLNVVGDSNDENNFPHKLLLTTTQVSKPHQAFGNNSSANIKLSKVQLHKIDQTGGFLGRILGPLPKMWLPLIGNVFKPLAKRVLIPVGFIHKKIFGSGCPSDLASYNTTLIISNEEINDIMKIVMSLEESALLIKRR